MSILSRHDLAAALPHGGRVLARPTVSPRRWHTAVVIPARNEAERIIGCLEALRCQWSPAGRSLTGDFVTVLVVNGTTDATATQALHWHAAHPQFPLLLVDVDFPAAGAHVGAARGLGLDLGVALLRAWGTGPGLLFSTDADSRLESTAIARARLGIERGADALGAFIRTHEPDTSQIGAVINAYRRLSSRLRQRYCPCPLGTVDPHGDFGGAGFVVTVDAYSRAGGLPRTRWDEDAGMRRRLLASGAVVAYPRDLVVYTSTRHDGRAEWGMAQQLAVWEADHRAGRWPTAPTAAGLVWKYALKAALREGLDPDGYFDPTGGLAAAWSRIPDDAPFEARWQRFWDDDITVELRERRFPQTPLPQAYHSLLAYERRAQALRPSLQVAA